MKNSRKQYVFWSRQSRWFLVALLLAVSLGCSSIKNEQRVLSLPSLPQGPIELRVAYVVNSRLPRLSSEQLQILIAATQTTARDHFGIELQFTPMVEIPVEALFKLIPEPNRQEAAGHIFDFKNGKVDLKRLEHEFGKGLKEAGEPLTAMIEYARPHLGELHESSYEELGAELAKLQLARLERWRAVPALDGGPAVDGSPYNEFMLWLALGYGELPYDLLLTNQLIASIEDVYPAVHAAIRGGYTNGVTTYSKRARYGTYSVWSTFAFLADDDWVRQMRAGETYTPIEAARLAGIGATHELGHQLFHYLHPFENSACLMNPVPMLTYRAWASKLSPGDCLPGSSPAMQPGAYKFIY